jgi:hypothetical protein
MARIAAKLMDVDGVRLYHDQALYKEPIGGITPWHADEFYWPLSNDNTVAAWIPLLSIPLRWGPLQICGDLFLYATVLLIVPIYPRGAAISQDLHGLPGALGVGFHKDELAIVNEIYGVGLDRVGRQVMISKMGLKGLNNGVLGVPRPLRRQIGFGIAPKDRRSRARRKDRADVARLFRYDGLIVNSFFKSRASQSLDGFFQVPGVVEYPNDGRHFSDRSVPHMRFCG